MNWYPLIGIYAAVILYVYTVSKLNSVDRKRKELELLHRKNRSLHRLNMFLNFAEEDNAHRESMMEMMWRTKIGKEEAIIKEIDQQLMDL